MDPHSLTPTLVVIIIFLAVFLSSSDAQSRLCRTACGAIPIDYPLGIDDGCGSPYYRHMLACTSDALHLRTPSGTYPVRSISYSDPHIVVSDPSMWTCGAAAPPAAAPPFALDTSTRFSLSPKNDYLFFNCSEESVMVRPRSRFCERFPERCGSACDSAAYLCRNMPGCSGGAAAGMGSCCAYRPRAAESLGLMLRRCAGYAGVYWRAVAPYGGGEEEVAELGVRVDFEMPVTTRCLRCRDKEKGGGTCGFDTESRAFRCLCDEGNVTTYCADSRSSRHKTSVAVVVGTTTASIGGVVGIGALAWYVRKLRSNKVVTCGVQSNENRLF